MATSLLTKQQVEKISGANKRKVMARIKIENSEDGKTLCTLLESGEDCKTEAESETPSKLISDITASRVKDTDSETGDRIETDEDQTRDMNSDREEREMTPGTEFIEFEFSPKKDPNFRRDRSASLEPEDVLDELYEAASKGDTNKLTNLIFAQKCKEASDSEPSRDKMESQLLSGANPNSAILNLLKRTTPIDKKQIADLEPAAKRSRIELKKPQVDFANVKNIRLNRSPAVPNVSQDSEIKVVDGVVKRKNPLRTPTPPPSEIPPVFGNHPPVNAEKTDKNLIDYSVLTKALTKTLQKKLKEGTDNDVKIVIFCNNKPIQSFSVRSNTRPPAMETESQSVEGSSLIATGSTVSESASSNLDVSGATPVNQILSRNPLYLSKHLASGPAENIPTISDVKAILERNKRIATESLARFTTMRQKTKRIPDEKLDVILKELKKKIADSNSSLQKMSSWDSNDASSEENSNSENKDDELMEKNLVISDLMDTSTDENCNAKDGQVKCDQCDKSFKQMRYLNRHKIRVHSTSKSSQESHEVISHESEEKSHSVMEKSGLILGRTASRSNVEHLKNEARNFGKLEGSQNVGGNLADMDNDSITEETEVNVDGEVDDEIDITTIKNEPMSEEEERDIQNVIADGNLLNLLEHADKCKRSLYQQDGVKAGVTAKDLLNNHGSTRSYSFDYRPPVTQEGLKEPVYVCEQCGKFYRARKTLKDHFLREHAKDKDDEPLYLYITGNKYQCPICFNNYHSGSELVAHTKKHTGELRSVCRLCGKVYSSVHVLRRHIDNIHADVKPRPFQCELCDYAASNKWHLKEHYRRHTGEQPYKCPVCEKSFSHQGTMNRHCKTIHRMEMPSQRPFSRHNITDLPDLPVETASSSLLDSSLNDSSLQYDSSFNNDSVTEETFNTSTFSQDSSASARLNMSMNDDSNLQCSEPELPDSDSNPASENAEDIDLSIVKTEPQEIDVM